MGGNTAGPSGWAHAGFGRRAFLTGGAAAGLALPLLKPAPARAALSGIPADGKVAFKVMRKGANIGQHSLRFEQDGDNLTVHVEIRITVHVGPVPVYHHVQRCTEHWKGDRFMALESNTSSNVVSSQTVTARRTADGVRIEPDGGQPYTASPDILPLTHWNRFAYQGPLFDPQAGKPLKETLVSRGDDTIPQADGSMVRVTRWSVTGDGVMDDYYDSSGVWAGLHVKVRDGSQVEYLRL